MRRADFLATIAARLAACNDDELAVLDRILRGIEKGHGVYGHMNLAQDTRDLEAEADDEARDWLVYKAMRRVQVEQRAQLEDTRRG